MSRPKRENKHVRCTRYLIRVLTAILNGRKAEPLPKGLSWEAVYAEARFQGVEAMAYEGVKEYLAAAPKMSETWRRRREQDLVQSLTQIGEQQQILKTFSVNGIRVLPFKGAATRMIYPQVGFRQMSDLDLLVDPEELPRAEKLLEEMGYADSEEKDDCNVSFKKAPFMNVELHFRLLSPDDPSASYYDTVWDRVKEDEKQPGIYRFTAEDEYIFLLIHFSKHDRLGGIGIRAFMDIYVYLRYFEGKLNLDYLDQEFEKLGLQTLQKAAEFLAFSWFSDEKKRLEGDEEWIHTAKELEKNSFFAGTYGSRNIIQARRAQKVQGEKKALLYLANRILRPDRGLSGNYPILKKYPVLYPVFFLYRIGWGIVYRRDLIYCEIKKLWKRE